MTAPRGAAAASAVAAALALVLSACGASSSGTAGTAATGPQHGSTSSASGGTGHRTGHSQHSGRHSAGTHTTGPASTASASPKSGNSGPSTGTSTGTSTSSGSTDGVEVMPQSPGASPSGLPGLHHGPSHTTPLIGTPLPGPANAVGHLVSGYPSRVLPGAPGSRILASSVAPSGNRLQVSLSARTGMRSLRLQEFYSRHLIGLGLQVGSTPTVGGSTGLAFSRGDNHVTLTIIPGIVTRYTIFATFSAAR